MLQSTSATHRVAKRAFAPWSSSWMDIACASRPHMRHCADLQYMSRRAHASTASKDFAGSPRKPWTLEELNKVSEMREKGIPYVYISEVLGRTNDSVRTRHYEFLHGNIKFDTRTKQYTAAEISKLRLLLPTRKVSIENCKDFPGRSLQELRRKLRSLEDTTPRTTKKPRWSEEEDRLLWRLRYEDNLSMMEISKRLPKRSYMAICRRVCRKFSTRQKSEYTAEDDEKILRMREAGRPWKLILSHFPGRSDGSVYARYYGYLQQREQRRTFSTIQSPSATRNHISISTSASFLTARRRLHTITKPSVSSSGSGNGSYASQKRRSDGVDWTQEESARKGGKLLI